LYREPRRDRARIDECQPTWDIRGRGG